MKFITLLCLCLFAFTKAGIAQSEFLEENLNDLLIEEINLIREKEKLTPLKVDEILEAAAFDQAEYILKSGKISHEQDRSKKETLLDRIIYYEGMHATAGENAAIITKGRKEKIEIKGDRVTINTDLKLVKAAIVSWLDDEDSKLNLLDPEFYRLGTSVLVDEKEGYILVAVMASEPYLAPNNEKLKLNFQGINRYDENCEKFLENHSTLPQLFSDVLKLEGNAVYLRYHDLSYINEIISSSGDAFAIDVIQRDQFSCNSGNRLFPTEINDGYLLSQAKRSLLNNFNTLKEEGEVKVKIAELPDFYQEETSELNLLIIKSGHYCETVPHNQFETEAVRWFKTPLLYIGKSDSSQMAWKDSTFLTMDDHKNWRQELNQIMRRLDWMNYNYQSIKIEQFLSPIGKPVDKDSLKAIFQSEKMSNVMQVGESKIDWEAYEKFKKGTFYELDARDISKEEEIAYLMEKVKTDADLADSLKKFNRLQLLIVGEAELKKEISAEKQKDLMVWLFQQNKLEPTLFLQTSQIDKKNAENFNPEQFLHLNPKQKVENLPVINNQIVHTAGLNQSTFEGNPLYLAFLELYLISTAYAEINFNYHIEQLKYWSENKNKIDRFEEWLKKFKTLSSKDAISKQHFARGMLNYYLIAADHYYEKKKFDDRKKAFEGIMNWQERANLSEEEILSLAKYMMHQDQTSKAIELLLPLAKSNEINQAQLFYLLQIGIYDRETLSEAAYVKFMKMAQEKFPKQFCQLFSKEKMGLQQLKNTEIKNLYCTHCQ